MAKFSHVFTVKRKSVFILLIMMIIFSFIEGLCAQEAPIYYSGKITIKTTEQFGDLTRQEGKVTFGKDSLDDLSKQFELSKIEKRYKFDQAILNGQRDHDGLSRIYKISFPETIDIYTVIKAFEKDPAIEYAEPIPVMYEFDIPNDTDYSLLGYLPQIHASEAWDIHHGEDGAEVLIGMCDSAVQWDHEDLIDNLYNNPGEDIDGDGHVLEYIDNEWVFDPGDINNIDDDENGFIDDFIGWNFHTDDGTEVNDPDGTSANIHGTHVTGIAAGVTNNGTGIAGIGWNVKFLPTKHSKNYLTWPPGVIYDAYDGVIYLAEMGCDIINCSWGGDGYSESNQEVLDYARSLGSIIVTAAGNANSDSNLIYPAHYQGVINVASVRCDNEKADYSNYGIGIDVSSPGGTYGTNRIWSTIPDQSYCYGSGTSMACPVVTGLFALLKSYHPDWSNEQLIYQVIGTCDDIDQTNPGHANMLGSGRINAYRALTDSNVTVPQELRLEVVELQPFNDGNNSTLEPGETASLGLHLRNYSHYVNSDNLTLTLSVDDDDDVTILNGNYTGSIEGDEIIELEDIFTIQISSDAVTHSFTMNIDISADIDITFGSEYSFTAYIEPSGIFVWDGASNTASTLHYSGEFIYDYLCEHDIPAIYSQDMPLSLNGFDAAFLSFGNYGAESGEDTPFINRYARTVMDYLENGGYLYIEGGSTLGYYQQGNTELHHFLGIEMQDSGECDSSPREIIGQENTLTDEIVFNRSNQYPRYYIDRYLPYENGEVTLIHLDYGNVAVQSEGSCGQKTYASAYSICGFQDGPFSSRRRVLLARILDYFGFPVLEANLHVEIPEDYVPHVPVTLNFSDYSVVAEPLNTWIWDFENDGSIESEGQTATFTFTQPGYQDILYEVSDGTNGSSYLAENCLYFYNGETAIHFEPGTSSSSKVSISAADNLNLTDNFTIEVWINPLMWSDFVNFTNKIIDKGSFFMVPLINDDFANMECLGVFTTDSEGLHTASTPSNSLVEGEWQHIAVSYNDQSEMKVYINGQEQEMYQTTNPAGPLVDNADCDLIIGNTVNPDEEDEINFLGSIDDVRIWNTVRTADEIAENMDHALQGTEAGLIGYWNMNEAIGDSICDQTGNNNTGYLEGVIWIDGVIEPTTAIDEGNDGLIPQATRLLNNYPNPFNPVTNIVYTLKKTGIVDLSIYNVKGQKVDTIVDEIKEKGKYSVIWNAENCSSGIYYLRLKTEENLQYSKAILLK